MHVLGKGLGQEVMLATDLLGNVLVQPDGWARGEREGYGEPCDVTSLSLSLSLIHQPSPYSPQTSSSSSLHRFWSSTTWA